MGSIAYFPKDKRFGHFHAKFEQVKLRAVDEKPDAKHQGV